MDLMPNFFEAARILSRKTFVHQFGIFGMAPLALLRFWTLLSSLFLKSSILKNGKIYRPISLPNVISRILFKLIYNNIKQSLPNCISPEQGAFVERRNIINNIIVAQDMVIGFNSQSSTENAIIILDISKAYDRLSWSFLLEVLLKHNINQHLILLINNSSPNAASLF